MAFHQNGVYLTGALMIAGFFGAIGVHEAGHPSLDFLIRGWTMPNTRHFC